MVELTSKSFFGWNFDYYIAPVNCVGVMGKGIALEFKQRYPDMYEWYKDKCKTKQLRPGRLLFYRCHIEHHYIICFPTKDHWRNPSTYQYIESGLEALREAFIDIESRSTLVPSVGMPALGCGNGGLDFDQVHSLVTKYLNDLKTTFWLFHK